MTITGGSALPKEDIDRMVKEAEEHAAEDKKRREEADARNVAEQAVYGAEKALADNGDKVPADVKTEVQTAIDELKKALEGTDVEAVKAKHTALVTTSQKIGEAVYAASQAEQAAGAGTEQPASSASSDEDVVDAEIVDEEDEKK